MNRAAPVATASPSSAPAMSAVVALLKPITWFPPMWAFMCGVVSSGVEFSGRWYLAILGIVLAGPLLCGASQVINDWFDREVDAINEPHRPIPSGRVPGRWGLAIALIWSALAMVVALALGPWVTIASLLGLVLAWAYSAPPLRLKKNGWWGNSAVAISYEGFAWVTGAAVMLDGAMPAWPILALALLYSIGTHGIMTLNDFKAIDGDIRMGVGSLPVRLGVQNAARVACLVMALPQVVVVALLIHWQAPWHALGVGGLLAIQLGLMARFLRQPRERALWYSALGVNFFVSGMMVSAFALRFSEVLR